MVRLTRIYTRTGDRGDTSLGDGTRVTKTHPRVVACGAVDELNAVLGMVRVQGIGEEVEHLLERIQNELFDLGADLGRPLEEGEGRGAQPPLRIHGGYVQQLEKSIDRFNRDLSPLRSFVLPGGSPPAAWLHLARTVCRRAERRLVALSESDPEEVNGECIRYLNRLSDLLFVLARHSGRGEERLWRPGG